MHTNVRRCLSFDKAPFGVTQALKAQMFNKTSAFVNLNEWPFSFQRTQCKKVMNLQFSLLTLDKVKKKKYYTALDIPG